MQGKPLWLRAKERDQLSDRRQAQSLELALAMEDARKRHREFASWHEAYAVILEELEEFWDSVKANDPDTFELYQVAACCLLAIKELEGTSGERELR